MSQWAKIKFFHDGMAGQPGATLTATNTATGDYSVNYIHNMLEVNMWKAADTADPCYITLDTGPGDVKNVADYLIVFGHNLGVVNATAALQYSDDGMTYADAFTPEALRSDDAWLKEFASPGSRRYWRLKITGHTDAPYMTLCLWGQKTELDYATASFDPHEQEIKSNVSLSYGGYVAGTHVWYTERSTALRFDDVDAASPGYLADGAYKADGTITAQGTAEIILYEKIKAWWETSGLNNFFIAWETSNSPDDIFLMRPDTRFSNPLKNGGRYRDVTINLKGRKG